MQTRIEPGGTEGGRIFHRCSRSNSHHYSLMRGGQEDKMGSWNITELQRNSNKWDQTVDQIVRIEKKIFPKHESLARSFETELAKKNSGLLYILDSSAEDNDNVAGYVMFSWPSSLCASITKLAGTFFAPFRDFFVKF